MNKLHAKLIPLIVARISPEVKCILWDLNLRLEKAAKITRNPWDDILATLLEEVIDIE